MPGEVGNSEHLVAQRRHEQQVHLGEDADHLLGNFAPEAVGLHEIHGGKKPRLAKNVGPRVGHLSFELIHPAAQT